MSKEKDPEILILEYYREVMKLFIDTHNKQKVKIWQV
jgi:hypothetical protein